MEAIVNRCCECWEYHVSLVFKDQGIPRTVIRHIYCPRCSHGIRMDEISMVKKEGWLIEYDPVISNRKSFIISLIRKSHEDGYFFFYVEKKSPSDKA